MPKYLIGIDIGGTFTDLVVFDFEKKAINVLKIPSTPENPENAVIESINRLNLERNEIFIINHASTVATNALLTHSNLPRAALITNKGFRDILEIGRQRRAEIYNLEFLRPVPLIPRKFRYTVSGRINPKGEEIEKINDNDLKRIVKSLKKNNIESVAISLLNSYLNSAHEIYIKNYLQNYSKMVFISSEIDPQYREYERTSTTVVNAVLSPLVSNYLENLKTKIKNMQINAPIYVMGSNGGLNTVDYSSKMPISIIESGPSAGVIASSFLAKKLNLKRVITFDMGGTTAKAGTIINFKPELSYEFEAAGKTHSGRSIKGSGYAVRYPFIDLAEVSAGGGTIAWLDETDSLRVGPESAGSVPGPAGYNRGGTEPTVTDASIVLGRLNQEYLLGGQMPIFSDLSKKAIEKIGKKIKMSVVDVADGILRIINNSMARAISIVSVERGRDPRDFSMIAFGGAGPLHACDLAEEMNISEIIVPEHPGLFSALGLITVDISRSFIMPVFDKNPDDVFSTLKEKAFRSLKEENFSNITMENFVDVRYIGQSFEITLPYHEKMNVKDEFDREHEKLYGFATEDPVEIVNAKIVASAQIPKLEMIEKEKFAGKIKKSSRDVYLNGDFTTTEIFYWDTLFPGYTGKGPAIIEGYDSTVVVNKNWFWELDDYMNIILRR